ncbi:C-C motif chemokine 5-like [Python bivittatus]|uniref:C-C motif chemokine 5-like n=1 Tax=Python bivittatus TaxID=176946 RepID=A0A9F2R9Y9_PYTBI|nr:C-C motif chemokine 5-like [Python bivittatus]
MNSSLAAFSVFLVAAVFLSQAQAQFDPSLCCFNYINKPVPRKLLKSYEHSNIKCSMPAIIFTTHRNVRICADPSAPWVEDRINHLS